MGDDVAPANDGQGLTPDTGTGTANGSITPDSSSSFNWELFPDVPEDQRGLLEPHLKKTQAHVTRLEQQIAPFKDILGSEEGIQGLQGLLAFDEAFTNDPKGVWTDLTRNMIETGALTPDVLQSFEFDQGDEAGDDGDGEVDPILTDLQRRLDERDEADARSKQQLQEQVSQELLSRQVNAISGKLAEAGLEVNDDNREAINDSIVAHIIVAKGNPTKALELMMGTIQGSRRALEQSKEPKVAPMPNGAPPTNKQPQPRGRNGFDHASQGARQFLEKQAKASIHN